ncbi:MAG: hypothetical protein ACRCZF_10035 [Gemmataceae bacterium]
MTIRLDPNKEYSQSFLDAVANLPRIDEAHARAYRRAVLEHARMGRSVPVQDPHDPTAVKMLTPAEIFAQFGFDEFGRPLPAVPPLE